MGVAQSEREYVFDKFAHLSQEHPHQEASKEMHPRQGKGSGEGATQGNSEQGKERPDEEDSFKEGACEGGA